MGDDIVHRVVVATRNAGKLEEIRASLGLPGWEFVTAADLGAQPIEVVEDGGTFTDNAMLKAAAYHERFRLPALADDSGLVVDALDGDPGVHSARYSGPGSDDASNNAKLLAAMEGVLKADRTARFHCAMVYIDEHGMPTAAMGLCRGSIAFEPRGEGGFGYDPLFLPDEAPGRTMAELDLDEKNAISHRGRALRFLQTALLGSEW
jgi:XTP/dITP diphosphohydrolase